MPSFGRWQRAGAVAVCDECPDPITPGEVYMRLGYVDDAAWRAITGDSEKRLYREGEAIEENLKGHTVRKLWEVVSEKGYPIRKWHRRCWLGHEADVEFTQRSRAV
jgi:hypothetical protein